MPKTPVIGIDLGTTNTLVAKLNEFGKTQILRTREGEDFIPSVVLFADDRAVVGREAILRGRTHPERLAACAKQQLGQPFYQQALGGERFSPEVIQACILSAVKQEWFPQEKSLSAVIAIPAQFNATQRHAVSVAAEMAGIHLIDLVPEPVAAALAFSENSPLIDTLPTPGGNTEQLMLVFDLGGYTFDASLLRVAPGKIDLVATVREPALGGHDWDLRLADYLAEPFIRLHKHDPRENPLEMEQLLQRATQMKIALSSHAQVSQSLKMGEHQQSFKLARDEFESMTSDLVERTVTWCENLLNKSQQTWSNIRRVLLVGGATRMPMLHRRLARLVGRPPDEFVQPGEAVARGAALYAAALKQGRGAPPPLQLVCYSTHGLGIAGTDSSGQRVNKILIPQGTPLPATAKKEFVSEISAAHAVMFTVLEGENRDPAKCVPVGRVVLRDLPHDVAGQWPVEIALSYSASGKLTVDAHVRYTDRKVHMETVRVGGVSQFHIDKWKSVITKLSGLAAMRQVRAWEKAADCAGPIVLAGFEPPPEPELPVEAAPPAVSFLQRLMPFVFRSASKPAD